ncbi:MAG: preprotein translocase subunit SecG [Rectinema sp.]
MGILGTLLLILFVIVCLLLIFFVVIQDEDSDSIGGLFAGGAGSAFGSRSSNVVIKITYVLGALFFILSFSMAIINKSSLGNVEAAAAVKTQEAAPSEWWKGQTPSDATQSQTPNETGSGTATTVAPAAK